MSKVSQAQIETLDFPYCVRLRRGMYISNRNQAVTEIIDNSVDEKFAGFCDTIAVVIQDDIITIQDNGRGIPVTPSSKKPEMSQVEEAFTTLHAGGKFGKANGYSKKTSGMNGVGGSCVQALSEWMNIYVQTDNKKYEINFAKGFCIEKVREVELDDEYERGTTVQFKLDEEIWADSDPLNVKALKRRVKQIAYLNPGLTMYMYVDRDGEQWEETFMYPEGLKSYVEELTAKKKRLTDVIGMSTTLNDIDIEIGMTYTDSYNDELYTFCNNMATVDHGDHLTGFTMGLTSAIKSYMDNYKITFECKSEDIREGLVGVVSVRVGDPIFEGQAKTKLKMMSVRSAVKNVTEQAILDYLDKNPEIAKSILAKIEQASKARIAAAKARETARKTKSIVEGNPAKLADCSSKKPEECELWLVEGDSAGGSAKQGRDRRTQAILPVFGKINNVEKSRLADVLKNQKLNEVVKAGKFGIGEDFDLTKSRYHKYIISADADVDGFHITCLWITYYFRYLRPIIEAGWLYIAMPPLFKIVKGKKIYYAYSDEERDAMVAELGGADNIQRYKGLGEMNPEQLWETTMNPENRRLIQVTIEDAEAAEAAISLCMSEDSSARKEWIMENALYAQVD